MRRRTSCSPGRAGTARARSLRKVPAPPRRGGFPGRQRGLAAGGADQSGDGPLGGRHLAFPARRQACFPSLGACAVENRAPGGCERLWASDGPWGRGHLALACAARRIGSKAALGMRAWRRERGQDALAPRARRRCKGALGPPSRPTGRARQPRKAPCGAMEGETPSLRGHDPPAKRNRSEIIRQARSLEGGRLALHCAARRVSLEGRHSALPPRCVGLGVCRGCAGGSVGGVGSRTGR